MTVIGAQITDVQMVRPVDNKEVIKLNHATNVHLQNVFYYEDACEQCENKVTLVKKGESALRTHPGESPKIFYSNSALLRWDDFPDCQEE